jgi:hypothetical protein
VANREIFTLYDYRLTGLQKPKAQKVNVAEGLPFAANCARRAGGTIFTGLKEGFSQGYLKPILIIKSAASLECQKTG